MGLIKITDDLYINNDLPGWARGKNQPKWHKSLYDRWRHMWSRCRNPEHPRYLKYKDCPIDERYIKLSNYVNDVQLCISCPHPFQKEKQIEEYSEKVTTLM